MNTAVVVLALGAVAALGLSLVLTQIGLCYLTPLRGACISVPSTALAYLALSTVLLDASAFRAGSALPFALAGCLFPAAVTLLTFEGNRRIGPAITGALGNLSPLFAVLAALLLLGEVPSFGQLAGWAWPSSSAASSSSSARRAAFRAAASAGPSGCCSWRRSSAAWYSR